MIGDARHLPLKDESVDEWAGCYDQGWGKNLTPDAYSHPAKVSFKLAERIYAHALENDWIRRGDTCLDPFGGICGFGFHAMVHGLHWIGCELEQKFVDLGTQNIALWKQQLKGWPNLGTARIVQGDSRNLTDVMKEVGIVVSSPPFKEQIGTSSNFVPLATPGNPKYKDRIYLRKSKISQMAEHGHTPGNLANLREGDIGAVIGSPPYVDSVNSQGHGIDWSKAGSATGNRKRGEGTKIEATLRAQLNYGSQEGQLGSMPEGDVAAVVSSPPFCDQVPQQDKGFTTPHDSTNRKMGDYGQTQGNLGNSTGDTFWSASREIVQGCHDLLRSGGEPVPDGEIGNVVYDACEKCGKPIRGTGRTAGGMAIFVTKAYVKNKAIVDFPGRWKALCESVGFKTVCEHKAMLVKNHGSQVCMNGECEEISTSRKSFFRRLCESKGSPKIDWEVVLCMVK